MDRFDTSTRIKKDGGSINRYFNADTTDPRFGPNQVEIHSHTLVLIFTSQKIHDTAFEKMVLATTLLCDDSLF